MNAARQAEGNRVARRQRGLSLVELMVALVIGSVLIAGAVTVYSNSKKSYGESEAISRLQETARFAMSILETDVRMANFWGLTKGPDGAKQFAGRAAQTAAVSPVAGTPALVICGNNFAVDLVNAVQGDNDTYQLSLNNSRQPGCDTLPDFTSGNVWTTTPVATADTLTVRRASAFRQTVLPAPAGPLRLCTSRNTGSIVTDGGAACGPFPSNQVNDLIVNAYYVDRNSQQRAGLPSLRRKMLVAIGGVPQFRDQEVIAGVEDLQIQLGVDPLGTTGIATRYVDPNALLPVTAQVVAVRIWLLVRSDEAENGFTDNRIYQYGDRAQANGVTGDLNAAAAGGLAYQPSASADGSFTGPQHVRRLLITRTIQIRNVKGT